MKLLNRSCLALATASLCLSAACGPAVVTAETDGETEGSSGTTGSATTNPNPTMPTTADPSAGTGDATGQPTTTTNPTTGVDSSSGGGSDSCCEAHDSPGCNDDEVVNCVCAQEASCCAFEWEQNCVDMALSECMATCDDPGTTTGDPGSSSGDPGTACTELIDFEMVPSEAIYSGAWMLGMSMVGEGEISVNQQGGPGSFIYEPDIPCDDTWHIWARAFDQGQNDSYFATLDGEPMPEAIFEGGCTNAGNGYVWAELNWREQGAQACDYVQNPWTADWTTGVHQIEFSFRESAAMGRILITNDPNFVPM